MEPTQTQEKNPFIIPGSILLAGILIAGAIFYSSHPQTAKPVTTTKADNAALVKVPPVTAKDHIIGNPSAKVFIVEYSDTDCPYCQMFMPTLKRIMNEYGKSGQVAWVYRHFAVHPKVPYEAQATECAAELGGNDAFWKYLDLLFSKKDFKQNPYLGVDPADLPKLAASIGLDEKAFSTCLDSGKYTDKVKTQFQEAVDTGGQGTPHTVLVSGNQNVTIEGAQPYENVKAAIDQLLKAKTN